jgi:hypothetical protein
MDMRRQATAYAELFHPGISGNGRFEAGLPIMLATLAGAIGQMGHWDEAKLRIFILRCIKEWDGQLWLFPDGGTFKGSLGSHELLQSRPYKGKARRFRTYNMPPKTGLFTYRGTAHGGAAWGKLIRMFVNTMVERLRITPVVLQPDPFEGKVSWEERLKTFQDAAVGIGPDQLVEARLYIGLNSISTPQSDEYTGKLFLTNDFKPADSIAPADDDLASPAYLPIFQLQGKTPTLLLPQSVIDALEQQPAAGADAAQLEDDQPRRHRIESAAGSRPVGPINDRPRERAGR